MHKEVILVLWKWKIKVTILILDKFFWMNCSLSLTHWIYDDKFIKTLTPNYKIKNRREGIARIVSIPHFQFEGCEFESLREQKGWELLEEVKINK